MRFNQLGHSSLKVSEVCLGTMTWGLQNNQADADAQLATAIEAEVNFIDTAEMYPSPPSEETYGNTERILGDWLSRHPRMRDKLVIMSKVAGKGIPYIRRGTLISGRSLTEALDGSLSRLQTEYVDVFQLHWPNRDTPHFGKHWPGLSNPLKVDVKAEVDGMKDILMAIDAAIKEGKILHWGLSDDTPWGIATFLRLCDEMKIARPVSIQNEFSLIHLKDWPYLIEQCALENIAYLPWSPLATGILTGKYLDGARPEGARWNFVPRHGLFRDKPAAHEATRHYQKIASDLNISSAQLALAWCKDVPGVTSTIIGATSTAQLVANIDAFRLTLDEPTQSQINEVLRQYPVGF